MQPARPGLMSPADSTPNLLSPGMPNNPHHWSTTHLAQFGSNDVGMRGMNGGGHAYGAPPSHMGFYTIGHPHHHFNRYRQPAHLQLARNNLQHSPAHSQSYVHVTSPHSMAQSRDSMQQRLQTMLQHQNASHFTHPSYPVAYPPVSNSYTFSPSNVLRSRPSFERMTSPQRRQSSDAILNDVVSSQCTESSEIFCPYLTRYAHYFRDLYFCWIEFMFTHHTLQRNLHLVFYAYAMRRSML